MKKILLVAAAAAIFCGCANHRDDDFRGGVRNDTSYEMGTVREDETLQEREARDYDPAPSSPTTHRDFPARVGPGQTGTIGPGRFDPYIPR